MSTTLTVTQIRTLTTPDGVATDATGSFSMTRFGYRDVADLQKQARERWHRPGYATVTDTPRGVRIDYALPKNVTVDRWSLDTAAEELSLS